MLCITKVACVHVLYIQVYVPFPRKLELTTQLTSKCTISRSGLKKQPARTAIFIARFSFKRIE